MDIENAPDVGSSGDNVNLPDSELFGKSLPSESRMPAPLDVTDRIKKKAKRVARQGSRDGAVTVSSNSFVHAPQRRWKNSRRSKAGRGLPKKGGAGGKGVWGLPGDELYEEEIEDVNDPNYDVENDRNIEFKEVVGEPSTNQYFTKVETAILEYFNHGDTEEVASTVDDLVVTANMRPYLILYAIQVGMEHKDSHREMISVLISDLYQRVLTPLDFTKGFDILLSNLPDLILDTPEAASIAGSFIARAIADDLIPPRFVQRDNLDSLNDHAVTAIHKATNLLQMKRGLAHLDNVWGMGGPYRPVKTITKEMNELLKEYISSRDLDEAQRCIKELEVPHFHHELVYEMTVKAMENPSNDVSNALVDLLVYLEKSVTVTVTMIEQGFLRVFEDMADIVIDIPLAYHKLERFLTSCGEKGLLTEKVNRSRPTRGRKRFVSEGDGGLIKPTSKLF